MKKIKKFINDNYGKFIVIGWYVGIPLIIIVLSYFIAYRISVSDLPLWFKAWLLFK